MRNSHTDLLVTFLDTVALVESIQKKIGEAFDIFDHESSKQVDVR